MQGRVHAALQTSPQPSDALGFEVSAAAASQTDVSGNDALKVIVRPSAPFLPRRADALDATTSIPPGDLFNYDVEVSPRASALVASSVDAAILALQREHELTALAGMQSAFEATRDAAVLRAKTLEATLRQREAERLERLKCAHDAAVRAADVQRRADATALAQRIMSTVHSDAMDELRARGHFYDPIKRAIATRVFPVVQERVRVALAERNAVRTVVEAAVAAAVGVAREACATHTVATALKARNASRVASALAAQQPPIASLADAERLYTTGAGVDSPSSSDDTSEPVVHGLRPGSAVESPDSALDTGLVSAAIIEPA